MFLSKLVDDIIALHVDDINAIDDIKAIDDDDVDDDNDDHEDDYDDDNDDHDDDYDYDDDTINLLPTICTTTSTTSH